MVLSWTPSTSTSWNVSPCLTSATGMRSVMCTCKVEGGSAFALTSLTWTSGFSRAVTSSSLICGSGLPCSGARAAWIWSGLTILVPCTETVRKASTGE